MATSISTKRLYCIGRDDYGQFGDGYFGSSETLQTLTPMKWSSNINVTDIFNGRDFSIYATDNNEYYSAGRNGSNECIRITNSKWACHSFCHSDFFVYQFL